MTQRVASVLICPGQGAQRAGGAADLASDLDHLPSAGRQAFALASEITGHNLWQLGLSLDADDAAALQRPSLLQPYLVAWAIAEHAQIAERIGRVDFVTGHSSGMNSAMALSGAIDASDALSFAYQSGRAMDHDCDDQPGGLLALVGAGRAAAEAIAEHSGGSLANHNAPDQTVLGGSFAALARAARLAPDFDCQVVELRVAGAFHTPSFERSDRANRALIERLPIAERFTPIVGNQRGQVITNAKQLHDELRSQYVRPVEWHAVLQTLHRSGVQRFVTLGPGNVMSGLVRRFGGTLPERIQIQRVSQLKAT